MHFALLFEGESRSVRSWYVTVRAEKTTRKARKDPGPPRPSRFSFSLLFYSLFLSRKVGRTNKAAANAQGTDTVHNAVDTE